MNVVEVAPILREVARRHKVLCFDLRTDVALVGARRDAMRELRAAGLTLRAVAELLGCDPNVVHRHVGPGRGTARAGSRCAACDTVRPLDEFRVSRRASDGRVPYCRDCARTLDRAKRKEALRRRANGETRHVTHIRLLGEVKAVLADTSRRHRVSQALIIERAVTRAMACTDCGRRLRQVGSDCCQVCDREWTQGVSA